MRHTAASTIALLLLAAHSPAQEPGLKKPYFAATQPGTFARYQMVDEKGAITETVYARLPDQGGDRWIEMRVQILTGQFKGPPAVMSYLIAGSFPLEKEGLDFLAGARRAASQVGGDGPTELPADTVKAIAANSRRYAPMVVWKGSETIEGRAVDHYTYVEKGNYANIPSTTRGDVWLSESVPFATVRESAVVKDGAGKVLGSYDIKLVESGAGAKSGLKNWSWGGAAARPGRMAESPVTGLSGEVGPAVRLTLAEAFQKELVSIACLVSKGSGGSRLRLTITNKSEALLDLTLTKAPMPFQVGAPIETLTLAADADQKLSIPRGGEAAPVEVAQVGRRVTSGSFTISRHQGTPLFQGRAEVGPGR